MRHTIALIPGDGIGKEVVPAAARVLDVAGKRFGFEFTWTTFDWSCETYVKTGRMMPEDGLEQLRTFESIFLGAVGFPGVPDHVSLWGLLIPIRRGFHQYINLRPVRLLKGVRSPLAGREPGDIDMLIVRENNEGEYSEIGGRLYKGAPEEMAVQQAIFTRKGCDRVMRFAFEQATKRRQHVTSATKSNGIIHSMPYWDERFAAMSREYPGVKTAQYHIDILTAHFVQHPDWFDVVVGSNLFGDILSDLGPAIAGSIGIAPGGNINPREGVPLDVRARPRLGARHRGQERRQPHRPDLDGRHDARASRPPERGQGGGGGDREGGGGGQDGHARPGRQGQHDRGRRRRRGAPVGHMVYRSRDFRAAHDERMTVAWRRDHILGLESHDGD
jgi:tartrate dehydrogenase/decarboxylase / D-malate dehydrogenase